MDTTIAMENAVLAATDLGYGTCWIGAFHEGGVVAILTIGVPAEQPAARSRRPLTELVSVDRYGQPWET